METMYYWYVFDYSIPSIVSFRDVNPIDGSEEAIIRKHGLHPSECEWLVSEEPLDIEQV
jgi:hypothetical protein